MKIDRSKRDKKLRDYKKRHPEMSNAALGRIFKISREWVRRILDRNPDEQDAQ